MDTTTMTPDEIKVAVNEAIDEMDAFTTSMGLDGLANEGLPALWGNGDYEYEVTRGPKIEMTVHDPIGDPIAKVTAEIKFDGSITNVTIDTYVAVPDDLF